MTYDGGTQLPGRERIVVLPLALNATLPALLLDCRAIRGPEEILPSHIQVLDEIANV
jgi:hypothetical protein